MSIDTTQKLFVKFEEGVMKSASSILAFRSKEQRAEYIESNAKRFALGFSLVALKATDYEVAEGLKAGIIKEY